MKKGTIVFGIAVILLLNLVVVSAITANMGNARMILYPEVNGWTTTKIQKSILVKNVNDVSINISLVADSDAEKFIQITDKDFVLLPGEQKAARFVVEVKTEGTYEGKINVFFKPQNNESGVVLSSTIIAVAKKDQSDAPNNNDSGDESNTDNPDSNNNSGISPIVIVFSISTLLLAVILCYLIAMLMKRNKLKDKPSKNIKKKKEKNEKIEDKNE